MSQMCRSEGRCQSNNSSWGGTRGWRTYQRFVCRMEFFFFCRLPVYCFTLPGREKGLQDSQPEKKKKNKKIQACRPHLHFINYLAEGIKIDLDGRENKSASRLLGHGVEVRTWVWITIRGGSDIRCQQSLLSSQQRRHTRRKECDTRGAF